MTTRSKKLRAGLALVLVPALVAGGTSWASNRFNDVPDTSPFHDSIEEMADAGITNGFSDGGFHPTEPVSRQGMAAFLSRGLGRTSERHTPALIADNDRHLVAPISFESPVAPGGSGQVLLVASVLMTPSDPFACPCSVDVGLASNGLLRLTPQSVELDPFSTTAVTRTSAIDLPGGFDSTFEVVIERTSGTATLDVYVDLIATYVPFYEDPGPG